MSRKFLVPIVLPANPTQALEAATKQYVDGLIGAGEVHIGPTDPGAAYELWVDEDAVGPNQPLPASMPRGWIGDVRSVTAVSGITNAFVDITSLTVTWTAEASRRYRIAAKVVFKKLTAAGDVFMSITDATNAQLDGAAVTLAINGYGTLVVERTETGLSGSQTRKVRAFSSTATATADVSAQYPATILVEDIGGV